ncbi:ABC transporter substrate-binding protein [Chelatococcus sp. GCM10030263]|uniref:ABC transporter substrate-binding protein n=1 Tax=Chelatococcus sp. GCM10030263 TaxID=3273387 RepID=UPI003605CAF6
MSIIRPGDLSRRKLLGAAAGVGTLIAAPSIMRPALAQGTKRDLRVGLFGGDFGNLSPVARYDIQGGLVMFNIFDGLVRIDFANRKIMPWIAESWTQTDPLTWRIKLREGVKWHRDYGEMTVDDVIYTWNYHLQTKSFQVGTALFPLDSMKAEGKYVMEVKTKQPFGPFPTVTMGYAGLILSERAHKEMGQQAYSAKPIGQGPFMVDSVRGNEVSLSKNPNYWRPGLPKLDKLSYIAIPDSSVRLQALQRREVDFITHPDAKDVKVARKDASLVTRSTPGWNWDYQQFNLTVRPDLPYHNKLVRQAISYAIDREAIVQEIYEGEATITDNAIPAGYLGHRENLMRYPKNGDLEKAKALIAQAGVKGYEVEVITSDKDWLRKELELVAAMVSQIGINYKIRTLDIGGFNNLWLNRKYEQHLEDITLVSPDPDSTVWWFLHSKGASSGYVNPQMDMLLDGARAEVDPSKRETMYHQIVDRTLEECPIIYHCNVNYVQVYDKRLTGFDPGNQEYAEYHDTTSWGA